MEEYEVKSDSRISWPSRVGMYPERKVRSSAELIPGAGRKRPLGLTRTVDSKKSARMVVCVVSGGTTEPRFGTLLQKSEPCIARKLIFDRFRYRG